MRKYSIYNNHEEGLAVHTDDRSNIADIFYKANMNHACLITSKPGAIRGNHYHKFTTQYTFVVKGLLEYWTQPVDGSEPATSVMLCAGDMAISKPYEIHAMQAVGGETCEFLAFAEGPRGGEDYETDTIRVDSIIPTK